MKVPPMIRRSDAASLALVLFAMAWLASGFLVARAQSRPEDIAMVQITNLGQRMDRTDVENNRRFDKIESMMQYLLTGMFLQLGAHGITLGRQRLTRNKAGQIILPSGSEE